MARKSQVKPADIAPGGSNLEITLYLNYLWNLFAPKWLENTLIEVKNGKSANTDSVWNY